MHCPKTITKITKKDCCSRWSYEKTYEFTRIIFKICSWIFDAQRNIFKCYDINLVMFRSKSSSWLFTGFLTGCVSHVEQYNCYPPGHLSSSPSSFCFCVAHWNNLFSMQCFVNHCLLFVFCAISFSLCIVRPSSIKDLWFKKNKQKKRSPRTHIKIQQSHANCLIFLLCFIWYKIYIVHVYSFETNMKDKSCNASLIG